MSTAIEKEKRWWEGGASTVSYDVVGEAIQEMTGNTVVRRLENHVKGGWGQAPTGTAVP